MTEQRREPVQPEQRLELKAVEKRREAALLRMISRKWTRPKGFRFDRDDANRR